MSKRRRSGKQTTANGYESRGWRIAFLVLAVVGICLAADLARLHVRVHTDPDYQSFCAMNERVNCETVAASDYAVALGLPVAVWGIVFYSAMALMAISGLRRRLPALTWPFGILAGLSAVSSAVGIFLFYVSHFRIESVCIVCAGTYLVNLAMLGVALAELRRRGVSPVAALREELAAIRSRPTGALAFCGLVAVSVLVLWASVPGYWAVETFSGPEGLTVGRTTDGHPWIGAVRPRTKIVEYSDYQCPHCQRGHEDLRALVRENPETVRLVHRHFPLDHNCNPIVKKPFHEWACEYSRLAYCAGEQDRFWEANDFLYATGKRKERVSENELALAIGVDADRLASCMASDRPDRVMEDDMRTGIEMGIRGTPTFVLNGETYPGRIPEDVLAEALGR